MGVGCKPRDVRPYAGGARESPIARGQANLTVSRRGPSVRSGLSSVIPLALALLLVVTACGGTSSPPNPIVDIPGTTVTPTATPSAAPTPLATEPVATSTITPTAAATAAPTAEPSSAPTAAAAFYKPPGWDGVSDLDCGDFDTHAHAQSFFVGTGGTTLNDPHRLDRDHDGTACETLP